MAMDVAVASILLGGIVVIQYFISFDKLKISKLFELMSTFVGSYFLLLSWCKYMPLIILKALTLRALLICANSHYQIQIHLF